MKHITGCLWQTLDGRHNIELSSKFRTIDFGSLSDEQALKLADELTTIATRITEHVALCQERRERA